MKRFFSTATLILATLPVFADNLFNWTPKPNSSKVLSTENYQLSIEERFISGRFFSINRNHIESLNVGDTFEVNVPGKNVATANVIRKQHVNKTTQIIAHISHLQEFLPVVITMGPEQFFMRIITAEDTYAVQGSLNSGSLINESQLIVSQNNQHNDVKFPPVKPNKHDESVIKANVNTANPVSQNSDDIATIKVLFVHGLTQTQINENYGGDINTQIQHIIGVTNQIYRDSQVNIEIESTSILGVDYPIENDSNTALDDITYGQHSAFGDIEDIRYQQGADMVVLLRMFVDGDDACGLAWANSSITSSINFMYSHTSIDCADYVNAHELGHNMGLAHSLAQGDTGYTFPFARGYRIEDATNGFSTVMAYSTFNAPKIYKFSNPNILCTELACGIDKGDANNGADASYALNQVRFQLADLYEDQADATLINTAIDSIVDSNLKQCVQQTVNAQNIRYVGQLNELYCNQTSINSLQGLGNFSSLTRLDVNGNSIDNFDGLTGLTKLSILSANDNPIDNFSGLSDISNITQLSLGNTGLIDLSQLSALTQLTYLWVPDNNIVNLSPLANLSNLNYLYAIRNSIQDISPLAQLNQLATLHLSSNQISQISSLRQLSQLKTLYLDGNNIASLNSLNAHPSLTEISANFNNISLIDNLDFPSLKLLWLTGNQLSAVPNSLNMPNLERLVLNENNIATIDDISSLTNLSELNLANNPITVFDSLGVPLTLTELNLANTQISSAAFLNQLKDISALNISGTAISDITELKNTLNLITLNIANTAIADINAIFSLHNFWSEINLTQSNNIYCWQIEHLANAFVIETLNQPTTCDNSQDNFDFDGDGVTNRIEISTGSNPIFHNTLAGELSFQTAQLNLLEESLQTKIKVTRSGGDFGQISVDVFTVDDTANSNDDYESVVQTLTFANREHVKQFTLTLRQDESADYGKKFSVNLNNPVGTTIGDNSVVTVTMRDQDSGIFSWQTSNLQIDESNTNVVINVERTGSTVDQAQVSISAINGSASQGEDFSFSAQNIVFEAGDTLKQVNVALLDDQIAEGNENFYLELTGAINAAIDEQEKLATITVADNDEAPIGTIGFELNSLTVSESTGEVSINVIRSNGNFGVLDATYEFINGTAINNSDFNGSNNVLSFANGETSKTIMFTVNDDSLVESTENFTIELIATNAELLGANKVITVSISDNDVAIAPTNNNSSGGGGGGSIWLLAILVFPFLIGKRRFM